MSNAIYKVAFETTMKYLNDDVSVDYLKGLYEGYKMAMSEEQPEEKRIRRMKMTDEVIERMKELADRGMHNDEIADKIGCSKISVDRKLSGYVRRKATKPSQRTIEYIKAFLKEGYSVEDIAEAVGYSTSVVKRYKEDDYEA